MAKRWREADIPDLSGKVALVTGANAGLGFEVAAALAKHRAHVVLACRNQTKAAAAVEAIRSRLPNAELELASLDLASLASVTDAAVAVQRSHTRLDILCNNAGLMALDKSLTEDGFEMQFGVNHLGHFALTADLYPLLAATPGARVVNMSSMGHRPGRFDAGDPMFERRTYRRWPAYFQSKLANILFTRELDRRLRATGSTVAALAAHPGGSRTDLGAEGNGVSNKALKISTLFTQSAAAGAEPMLRAATDPQAKGGEYYGPRFGMWGHAVLETPSRHAQSDVDAGLLWSVSEQLTGRRFLPVE